ncbi:MAG: signal peptide peptidase SppA [Saprospiraceae bacterium]
MNNFFKMLFASCLGVALGLALLGLIGVFVIGALAGQSSKPKAVPSNTVLHLKFDKLVPELTNNADMQSILEVSEEDLLGLTDIVEALRRAKKDDHIKGIFLETDMSLISGFATTRVLRTALEDFKKSGKFIFSHGKFYLQNNYYLCSVADEIFINPLGICEVRGYSVQIPFYKNMIDRLGVNMQIYYAGKFKGATEPFRLDKLSAENRLQYKALLSDIYGVFLRDVATSRKLDIAGLRNTVDNYLADSPQNAVKSGLLDEIAFRDDVLARIRKKLGLKAKDNISMVTLEDYAGSNPAKKDYREKNKIAVVFAEGNIVDGKGANGAIGDSRYVKALEKILKDDKIKAVVLRINSPGGSALASENILHAVNRLKAAGKPIVVSMGDYAASGGYYIACQADSIFAEPNTLTGSIGVFRIVPSMEKAISKNLGITFDSVNTGPYAAGLNLIFSQSPEEARKLQASTEEMYEVFLGHVAKGRKMSRDSVNAIAQGRVWSGSDARDIGLVDGIGGIDQAIASAARLARIKSYRTVNYPAVMNPLEEIIMEISGQTDPDARTARMVRRNAPELYPFYKDWAEMRKSNGIQARMLEVVK